MLIQFQVARSEARLSLEKSEREIGRATWRGKIIKYPYEALKGFFIYPGTGAIKERDARA